MARFARTRTGLLVLCVVLSVVGGALDWPWGLTTLIIAAALVAVWQSGSLPAGPIRRLSVYFESTTDDEHKPVDLGLWVGALLVVAVAVVAGTAWIPFTVVVGDAIARAGVDARLRAAWPRSTAWVDRVANRVYDRF